MDRETVLELARQGVRANMREVGRGGALPAVVSASAQLTINIGGSSWRHAIIFRSGVYGQALSQ